MALINGRPPALPLLEQEYDATEWELWPTAARIM